MSDFLNNYGIYIILGLILLVLILISIIVLIKQKGLKKIKEVDGVRYDNIETEGNEEDVNYVEGDRILGQNKTYIVKKNTIVVPGKYVILSSSESQKTFNVRINGIVKAFEHNTNIVFEEGDEIVPISTNIILR